MPELSDSFGLPLALGVGVVLIVWYFAGNELMRRRAHRLAVWSRRVVEPLGRKQSIRWLGGQAFRIEVEDSSGAFSSVSVTGLVEAWDTPFVWAWNRLHGRRDMIQLQATLRTQPLLGLELFRPGTMLAGDARGFARQEGWSESPLEEFVVAAPNESQKSLGADLLDVLHPARDRLLRLALRRQGAHLTLAVNVPDPARFDPVEARQIVTRVVERLDKH